MKSQFVFIRTGELNATNAHNLWQDERNADKITASDQKLQYKENTDSNTHRSVQIGERRHPSDDEVAKPVELCARIAHQIDLANRRTLCTDTKPKNDDL